MKYIAKYLSEEILLTREWVYVYENNDINKCMVFIFAIQWNIKFEPLWL